MMYFIGGRKPDKFPKYVVKEKAIIWNWKWPL